MCSLLSALGDVRYVWFSVVYGTQSWAQVGHVPSGDCRVKEGMLLRTGGRQGLCVGLTSGGVTGSLSCLGVAPQSDQLLQSV